MRFEPKPPARIPDAELLDEIRRVVRQSGGVVPSQTEFLVLSRFSIAPIRSRFGSYNEAVRKAGFSTVSNPSARIEEDLRKVLACVGGFRFSHSTYKKHGGVYADKTIKSRLEKSWREVMDFIGARQAPRTIRTTAFAERRRAIAELSDDAVLNELGCVWRKLNRRPSYLEFKNEGGIPTGTLERRFGSWKKAVEAYCDREGIALQGTPRTHVAKELLIRELKSIHTRHPNDMMTHDFYRREGGAYSIGTFQSHFGNWSSAVKAAGGLSGRYRRYTNDELFDEMQRLWEDLGQQPTWREMREKGEISPRAYKTAFGSWAKAVRLFCDDRNADREKPDEDPELSTQVEAALPLESAQSSVLASLKTIEPEELDPPLLSEHTSNVIIRQTSRNPSPKLRFEVLRRDSFTCQLCGRSHKQDGVTLEVDHKLAYSRGGETTYDNLWTLCRPCNNGKSDVVI